MGDESSFDADDAWALLDEAVCVTWVRAETEDVIRAFNGEHADLDQGRLTSVADQLALRLTAEPEPVFLLRLQGEWIIVLEPHSNLGANDEVLLDASGSGEALNLTWDVNMHGQVSFASDSVIAFAFDPAAMGAGDEDLDDARQWSRSLGIDDEDWRASWKAAAFALAQGVTGIEIDDTWMDQVWVPIRIRAARPQRQGAVRLPYPDMRELLTRAPQIRDIVDHPGHKQLPKMLRMLVALALSTADARTPLTESALAAIETKPPEPEVERLVQRLQSLAEEYSRQAAAAGVAPTRADDLHRKRKALLAGAAALGPDPLTAFPEVVSLTGTVRLRRDNDDYLSLEVLNICYLHISRNMAST
ncbi:DUF6461 domain-containing protein [Microtetraspora sp. NBRC 16547]|uniref:DUF6461 domain-containing protein n=1 Tax=Microtetraspora sp. NBRC 16547 TaxID=3030993 RepID=UPI002552A28D|nr:DUF6461 domain-containing protein [Microtetraspora sp. NBRC 16547]